VTAAELAKRLNGVTRRSNGWCDAQCPSHHDEHASLSFRDGDRGVIVKCQANAGCTEKSIAAALGIRVADLFHQPNGQRPTTRSIIATYDYTDKAGQLLFQAVRYHPKDFKQRRPDGQRGWVWDLAGVERVLYRLPELKGQERVIVVEGEKDVDRLRSLGLTATTNVMGAGKWKTEYTAALLAAGVTKVVIIPDNDEAGQLHATKVAASCLGAGLTVKTVRLPGLPPIRVKHGEDVSDWLDAGHTRDELESVISGTSEDREVRVPEEPVAMPPRPVSPRGPKIDAGELDLARVSEAAWAALLAANEPPAVFTFAGHPARVVLDDHGTLIIERMGVYELRHRLARVADWFTKKLMFGKPVTRPAYPPVAVVQDMFAQAESPLPRLARVVEVPIFTSRGTVLTAAGYDPGSEVLLAPPLDLVVPSVPLEPTTEDLARARRLLLEELLGDFPFVGGAERAQAVAMLIEPIIRDLIDGPTPLYLIEKPTPGTGASLLAELVARLVTGRPGAAMTEGRDEDEWRKRITSKLITGAPIVLLDNVRRRLDSAAVASAITAAMWEDRRLTQTEMVRVPVRCTWIATGNNPSLSGEMVRRSVRIRLDAKTDRPWLRDPDQFRHADLRAWVHERRGELLWAALVLGRAWIARGRPASGPRQLGMFESWSRVLGGILATAEIPGFLGNLDEFYATTDAEGAEMRAFLASWWDKHRDADVTAAQLFELATAPSSALDIDAKTEQGRKIRFGRLLSDLRDRRYHLDEGLYVHVASAGTYNRAVVWKLTPSDGGYESMSVYESVSPAHTRAREKVIGAEKTQKDSETHTSDVPDWVRNDSR
jgi:putative DNA primase/helicase